MIQREHFDNFVDFLEIGGIPAEHRRHEGNRRYQYARGEDERSWAGVPDGWPMMPQAFAKKLALGYEEGANRVAKMRDTISVPEMVNVRRRPTWGEQGDFIDMDRVRAGQLDIAWRGPRKVICQPPRVLIMADVCANAFVDADSMAWRGVAALALADALNEAGYQIAILMAQKTKTHGGGSDAICITAVVKSFRAPLSILDLASAVVLPATFRVLGINADWFLAKFDLGSGCGTHDDLIEEDAPDMGQNLTIILDSKISDAEAARRWATKKINSIQNRFKQQK